MLTVERCRMRARLITWAGLTCMSLLGLHACRRQDKWEGHTFIVKYAWDSNVQALNIKDAVSGLEINDPAVRARILDDSNRELPVWIRASKLKRANGTFHIRFLSEGASEILETRHGFEGAGPEFIEDPDTTALMMRAHEGGLDQLRELIDKGDNLDARDQRGITALIAAVSSHRIEVLRYLLDHGADINARTLDGETALTLSASSGQADMVAELVHRGAVFDCNFAVDRQTLQLAERRGDRRVVSSLKKIANCQGVTR
jgi:hypothetical protein